MTSHWPPLPRTVQGAGGPIRVRLVRRAMNGKVPAFGIWDAGRRLIQIERGIAVEHKHRVLFHELTHAALDDAGIAYLLTDEGNESICEAMATARIRELRGALGIE